MFSLNISLFQFKRVISESFLYTHVRYYNGKIDTVAKRGAMLTEFIANKDKRKKWYYNIQSDKLKARSFEKLHKPHRRKAVLSSLFIKSITDVISTGDVAPQLSQYKVEITGLKISPCNKILNIFWQVPVGQLDCCKEVSKLLLHAAPKIRAELISRNVVGRVPFICFLRDATNAKVAAFEKAMQNLDLGLESDSNIVVDNSFLENMYSFKSEKVETKKPEVDLDDKQELAKSNKNDGTEIKAIPEKPIDMKCDIFGLDHDTMMGKVIALKNRKGPDTKTKTALITPENLKDDLFEKIPGICFEANSSSRDDILKKFHIQRKIIMKNKKGSLCRHNNQHNEDIEEDDDYVELSIDEEDVFDETDNSHC